MDKSASSAAPDENRLDLVRLVLIAAVLPAVIATVNYALVGRIVNSIGNSLEVCAQFTWYVVQVGLIGYVVGSGINRPALRWIVFGWVLLLVNLLTLSLAADSTDHYPQAYLPPAALIAGQIGLCVVWAFLGDTRWPIRWPAMILSAAALHFLWQGLGQHYSRNLWTELLALDVITLALLCGIMRLRGYRLIRRDDWEGKSPATGPGASADARPLQFGIKHVLIWTTALAILLGAARSLDLLTWAAARELLRGGITSKLTVAAATAIMMIVALWVAVGRGHWAMRYAVGLILALVVGGGVVLWSRYQQQVVQSTLWGSWGLFEYDLIRWYSMGWWWLGWLFLSGGLLAATLIILRVRGYRLVRLARQTTVRANAA
jgi:hypothetical protein